MNARRSSPPGRWFAAALSLLAIGLPARGAPRANASAGDSATPVTPVVGESWARHLRVAVEKTAFGATGGWGGTADLPRSAAVSPAPLAGPVIMPGREIYRLSCRSCHRADGGGAPPEILPLTPLVQATSASIFREKIKERGLPVDEAALARNAADAESSLRKRIREGGEKMPPFPQLDRAETESLVAYLKELSGVPGPGAPPPPVREPALRIGELVVKGTCHICHDATPAPGYRAGDGNPPPLSAIVTQRTCAQVVRKVREGLAEPSLAAAQGRMPVFGYLSAQEVTAAYVYLLLEPPSAALPAAAGGRPSAAGGR